MIQRDEQRVIDALQAFTGGLTVTDQDIITAASRVRESVEPTSPRRRLVIVAAAVAAVLAAGFFIAQAIEGREDSAPPADSPSSPADTFKAAVEADAYNSADFTAGAQPTVQDLAGFWLLREPYFFSMFVDGDGDWWLGSPRVSGVFGQSTLVGDTWTRRHADNSECAKAEERAFYQAWRAALATDGSLRLELTGGDPNCTPADAREVWDRVTPGSPVGEYLLATTQAADWQEAPRTFRWQGLYVAPATGHVLEVADDGTYRYYDAFKDTSLNAADRGEIYVEDSQTRMSCAGGSFNANLVEVAQLPGVDGYVGSFDAVRVAASETCSSGVSAQSVWVKLAG